MASVAHITFMLDSTTFNTAGVLPTLPVPSASNRCWPCPQCVLQKLEVAETINTSREESSHSCLLCISTIIWERPTCLAKLGPHVYATHATLLSHT